MEGGDEEVVGPMEKYQKDRNLVMGQKVKGKVKMSTGKTPEICKNIFLIVNIWLISLDWHLGLEPKKTTIS